MPINEISSHKSFLFVLHGVIIGMALAKIISGYALFIEKRDVITLYWLHSLLSVSVFILLIQYWFWLLTWQTELKNFWLYIVSLLYPLALYFIATLLIPDITNKIDFPKLTMLPKSIDLLPKEIDLENHYFENKNWIYGIALIGILISISTNQLFFQEYKHLALQFIRIAAFILAILLLSTNRKPIHSVGGVVIFITLSAFIITKYWRHLSDIFNK